jgi:ethanolamine ammonia-lyase small subunit
MKHLRDFTLARVGLQRAGNSLATREVLAFQLAHAQARDAVAATLDARSFQLEIESRGWPVLLLASAAADRSAYLRRPNLGRRLSEESRQRMAPCFRKLDVAVVVADGLSALAVQRHALPLLEELTPRLVDADWTSSPLCVVERGRVAIGDEIGQFLNARLVLVLIGERPGLSSPDSLGAYLTWDPAPGKTDAERNCISNIRPEGLGYREAAERIFALLTASRQRQLTGVGLKEDFAILPER